MNRDGTEGRQEGDGKRGKRCYRERWILEHRALTLTSFTMKARHL